MIGGLDSARSVHFIGVGGTAMAATAAALQERGIAVTGSDQNLYPPMSTFLADRSVPVREGYGPDNLEPAPDLVVVGNALSRGNPEVEAVLEKRLRYCSLPELLKEGFIRGRRSLVVAGTHGKTSTTSLLLWLWEHSGRNPSYLIGGVPENLGQGARFTDSEWMILEGDEYDTAFFDKRSKFLHYLPETAILNNLEFDHADIFRDLEDIQAAFRRLTLLVPGNGLVLGNGDDPNLKEILDRAPCPVKRFGLGPGNDLRATDLELGPGGSRFRVGAHTFRIGLIGALNVRNALAAIACGLHHGLEPAVIQSALDTFKGIRRRMEIRGEAGGVTVVDDFAHHPTAIRETLKALRIRFPGARLWAVFEPRSNTTRRRVFQQELTSALAEADIAVVSQVARLELLPELDRLQPDMLVAGIQTAGRKAYYLPDVEAIVDLVRQEAREGDVVAVLSNGGFGGIHGKLLDVLGG